MFFQADAGTVSETHSSVRFKPGSLRRIKILAEMKDAQLAHLADFLEFQEWPQHAEVIRQGEPGDAMFLIMKGELRARTMMGGRETILTTFGIGDFFGEMSLFDQGPRSADVVANLDCTLLRLSTSAFERLTREMPSLATPFLQATARTLSARIRADNKRLTRVTQQFPPAACNGRPAEIQFAAIAAGCASLRTTVVSVCLNLSLSRMLREELPTRILYSPFSTTQPFLSTS